MVDNSKHKVLCIPKYNTKKIIKQSFLIQYKLTCEQINSRSHLCLHATCNCPTRQSAHFPVHLCSQVSILSHGFGQENRFNSSGEKIMRHGTSTK